MESRSVGNSTHVFHLLVGEYKVKCVYIFDFCDAKVKLGSYLRFQEKSTIHERTHYALVVWKNVKVSKVLLTREKVG